MTDKNQLMQAQRTISSGRLLAIVTAIPVLGSLLKLFYLGSPVDYNSLQIAETAQKAASQPPVEPDTLSSILLYFPTLDTNQLATADNLVSAALFIGLIFGLKNWKKGLSALQTAQQSNSSKKEK